jgi:hypothetical protein
VNSRLEQCAERTLTGDLLNNQRMRKTVGDGFVLGLDFGWN